MKTEEQIKAKRSIAKENLRKACKILDKDNTKEENIKAVDDLNKVINDLNAELKQIKEDREREELEKTEQYNATVASLILEKIEEFDIKQIIGSKSFFVKIDGIYHYRDLTQLDREIFRFASKKQENMFLSLMDVNNRNYLDYTFTFGDCPDNIFNMGVGVRERWLKHEPYISENLNEYKCPEGIEILLTSLSSGNQEIRNHIEECIVRKYRHPGDYRLPAYFMFGQGGVGKNEFNTDFLGGIFKDSCIVTNFETLTKNPAMLLGKVCVLVDETVDTKSDYDKFKSIASNKNFLFKKLFTDVTTIPNIMWLHISGQGDGGPLSISNDSTTRRFSAMYYTKDIFQWMADRKGLVYNKADESKFKAEWADIKQRDFTDENLSIWLGWAMAKFKEDLPVAAYHGEAFQRMIDAHKGPLDDLVDSVLLNEYTHKPDGFTMDELYRIYKEIAKVNHSNRSILGRNKFISNLTGMISRYMVPGWDYQPRQYWKKDNGEEGQSKMIVKSKLTRLVSFFNENVYFDMDQHGRIIGLIDWTQEKPEEKTEITSLLLLKKTQASKKTY